MRNYKVRNNRAGSILKKGACIALCAVLVGTMTVSAAVKDDGKSVLLMAETESDGESSSAGKGGMDVSAIVQQAMPSVVSITTKSIEEVQNYYFDFFNYGGYQYAPQEREVEGSASGIIIGKNEEQLLIATNYHVVEGATTLTVSFIDGTSCEAHTKGTDSYRDLAVVSVSLSDIPDETMDQITIATIGSSDDLLVGEQVVAIGNALGYGQSVTTGIVSAKNRRLDDNGSENASNDKGVNLIQTDAAINPGNSGGALLNMNGEVVGINSSKLASTEVEGMCYAIAISDVADILQELMNETPRERIENGEHGYLGITGRTVSSEAIIYGIPQGVFVDEVTRDSAADKAGITDSCVITEFDGKIVTTIQELVDLLEYYAPGEEVDVMVAYLGNGGYEEKTVTVTLDVNPNPNPTATPEVIEGESDRNLGRGQNGGSDDGSGNGDQGDNSDILDDYFG